MGTSISPEEYLRSNIRWRDIESIIDVGTGHSGVFDYERFQDYYPELSHKACLDVNYFRPDIDKSWQKILASATHLPLRKACFDHVQSTEMIEHIRPEYHRTVLKELKRVASKCVFLTATGVTHHLGPEQIRVEALNPYNKYLDMVSRELLEDEGFEILFNIKEEISMERWHKKFGEYGEGIEPVYEHIKAFYDKEDDIQ